MIIGDRNQKKAQHRPEKNPTIKIWINNNKQEQGTEKVSQTVGRILGDCIKQRKHVIKVWKVEEDVIKSNEWSIVSDVAFS